MSRLVIHSGLAEAIDALSRGLENCTRPEDRMQVRDYLAALAPVLARATLGIDVLPSLEPIERLLGNTWLVDESPFKDGLALWRQFKSQYECDALAGLTVNERLSAMGLLDSYDRARSAGDSNAAAALLRRVQVDEDSIAKIVRFGA